MSNISRPIFSPQDLGVSFRENRRALQKTQDEIAGAVGCSRQAIIDLEAGRNVTMHTVIAALAALGKGLKIMDARMDVDQITEMFRDE